MSNFSSGIYTITNIENGKFYIGSSLNMSNRRIGHYSSLKLGVHANRHLQNAVNIYGIDKFKFAPILYCEKTDLIFYEQQLLDTLLPDYNICKNATSCVGVKRTQEAIEKHRQAIIGRVVSQESKYKQSQTQMGHIVTKETREKMSKAAKERFLIPGELEKNRERQKGHVLSQETKDKMSISRLGHSVSEETRRKISETRKLRYGKLAQAYE